MSESARDDDHHDFEGGRRRITHIIFLGVVVCGLHVGCGVLITFCQN